MNYSTQQEDFWAGSFGNDYTDRNSGDDVLAAKIANFSAIMRNTSGVQSCLELGANKGLNLRALNLLMPNLKMQAVEINEKAAKECAEIRNVEVFQGSAFDFPTDGKQYDLAFTSGVLIHIAPEKLNDMYDILYKCSKKYVLIFEYYNPTPIEVVYRGNTGKLFKRDFAGEFMDRFPDVKLVDYGFFYHRDYNFPTDDSTWFLLEKK